MKFFSSLQPRLLLMAGLLAASATVHAQGGGPATTVSVSATLDGNQQVPQTNSTATGTFAGSVDMATRVLTYTVTYTGLTPSAAHIHQAGPGHTGAVVVPFSSVATSPITGTATLTQTVLDSMLAGRTYVNLHTAAFPNGEIRGNIAMAVTGIAPEAVHSSLALYPNPARETVALTGAWERSAPVELLDNQGRVVRTIAPQLIGSATLDLHGLPAGVYVVRVGAVTRRLVVK